MARFTNCGVYNNGAGLCDVLADNVTGELILLSDLQGNCYFSELTCLDPIPVADDTVMEKMLAYFGADGGILSQRHIITLKDNVASYRNYADNTKVEQTVQFDTDMVCDITNFDMED